MHDRSAVTVVGSYVQDLAFETKTLPAVGETRIAPHFRTGPGGKGFNQAVACHRQGVKTLFMGAVGDDVFGRHAEDFARKEWLRVELEKHPDSYTSAASIVVDQEGRNQIVVALGANNKLTAKHIEEYRRNIAESALLVCQLECSMEATQKALEIARDHGVPTLLNPAPINEELSPDILQHVDILTPNESEFRFLMKRALGIELDEEYWKRSEDELHDLCSQIRIPTTVLTLGEKGSFVSHNTSTLPDREPNRYSIYDHATHYKVPAFSVKTVDTTGAGDAFSGGLAAGMMQHPDNFRRAVRMATGVAALSVTKPGTAPSMPTRDEVTAFLDQNPSSI